MNRRKFIKSLGSGVGILSLAGRTAWTAASPKVAEKPNVVLIMTDDQGYGDLACHGHPFVKTPNLDKLHSESVRLTDYHASPLCSPTRASLMTGRYCRHIGVSGTGSGQQLITRGVPTVANIFSDNGYHTGVFGKWHLGSIYPYRPIDRGFQEAVVHGAGAITTIGDIWGNDYFDDTYWHNGEKTPYRGFCTDVWFDNAKRFIRTSKEVGRPFFCYIPTNIVHGPHYAPKKYIEMYEGKQFKKSTFFAAITHFDKCLGELRDFLRTQGMAENTIFIFTTDNGSNGGHKIFNAGMRGGKGSAYDGGHRLPFFIHWPDGKLTGGRDINQISAHIDVLPTLVDLCGLRIKGNYKTDGLSLKPVLDGTLNNLCDRILVESFLGVVMTKQWRLLQDHRKDEASRTIELYDIQKDPGQKDDVADDHPEIVTRLSAVLDKVNAQNHTAEHGYIIGTEIHNPIEFTPDHWIDRRGLGWWQSGIIEGDGEPASVLVEVGQDGTYEFSLRRWPKEVNKPISSAAKVTVPSNNYGGTKTVLAKALPVVRARFKVCDFDKSVDITDEMVEAKFRVQLKKGDCEIKSAFSDKQGKEYGVYYMYVERL